MSANQFDLTKPVFDMFALRSIRGDALLRYNTLNQSEPLRINLFGLSAFALFSAPLVREAVGGEPMGVAGYAASTLAGLASVGLFVRECGKRSKQLARIEKELNAENMQVRLPSNALANIPYGRPESLLTLKRSSSPPRIIAVCGTASQLEETLMSLRVFGKRLKQSSTFVVVVPVDDSKRSDWGIRKGTYPWLAEAYDIEEWKAYFDQLLEGSNEFRWFGLNSNGRSFGSGSGESPQWLQVLGQYLRPTEMLDEQDANVSSTDKEEASIVECQKKFYTALTTGDQEVITALFSPEQSSLVSEVRRSRSSDSYAPIYCSFNTHLSFTDCCRRRSHRQLEGMSRGWCSPSRDEGFWKRCFGYFGH
jgi:hypothetical protein